MSKFEEELRFKKLLPEKFRNKKILEIGGSYNPIAPRSKGFNCFTVDHDTTENIQKKYEMIMKNQTYSSYKKIENIDYVWSSGPLDELIKQKFDIIIASHVIEHVPDILGFLKSLENLILDNGVISLAIPDKRYTFDFFRFPTEFGIALDCYNYKSEKHSDGDVFNNFYYSVFKNDISSWSDDGRPGNFKFLTDHEQIKNQLEINKKSYVDVHKWVVTPSSFKLILSESNLIGITSLKIEELFDTRGCEFIIHLSKSKDKYISSKEILIFSTMNEILNTTNQFKYYEKKEIEGHENKEKIINILYLKQTILDNINKQKDKLYFKPIFILISFLRLIYLKVE